VSRLALVPLGLREANRFVGIEHRHLSAVIGCKFALGAEVGGKLVGVVIVARTTAAGLHSPLRAEVTRLATDGTFNACSFLYQRAKRVCQAMGYTSLKTYTRTDESGASLRAIGACCEAELKARSWAKSNRKRTRADQSEPAPRLRWELLDRGAA
jgi:hypothetical protein